MYRYLIRVVFVQVDPNNQVLPNGKRLPCLFPGFQSVTIIDSAQFDSQFAANCWVDPSKKQLLRPNCTRPTLALNCSQCGLDGLTIIGATGGSANAGGILYPATG
jgi:hypothetical protein